MIRSKENVSREPELTERDLHHSGIPAPGELGTAKKQVWAFAAGVLVLLLIIVAAIIDVQV